MERKKGISEKVKEARRCVAAVLISDWPFGCRRYVRMYRGLVAFGENGMQARAFPANAAVYNTALILLPFDGTSRHMCKMHLAR